MNITDYAREALEFQIQRLIAMLYKAQLVQIEDLKARHEIYVQKLKSFIPEEYHKAIDSGDYLCDDNYKVVRKRTLDKGNDVTKEIFRNLDRFDVEFKFNK